MARTYHWSDAVDFAKKQTKGTPTTTLDARICDLVSSEVWGAYAWYLSKQTIASGTIPLVDNQQDYDPPANIYVLTKGSLVCTSTTPVSHRELDVVQEQDVNMMPISPTQIRSIALQAGVGKLRLESAVVTSGQSWEIRGEYKANPPKVTDTNNQIWWDDQFFNIAVEGLVYWAYKLADDKRAGGAQTQGGRIVYAGKYADFRAAIDRMKEAEDFGGVDGVFPSQNLSDGRQDYVLNIFGAY